MEENKDELVVSRNASCLVGIAGPMGSGKSTVSSFLVTEGFVELAFADPIKQACKTIWHLDDQQLWGAKKDIVDPRLGIAPRTLFQIFGTDLIRECLPKLVPDYLVQDQTWVWSLGQTLQSHSDRDVVVSDVRFRNEVEWLKAKGGQIWWIERPDLTDSIFRKHKSENDISMGDADMVFVNNSTIDNLFQKIKDHL